MTQGKCENRSKLGKREAYMAPIDEGTRGASVIRAKTGSERATKTEEEKSGNQEDNVIHSPQKRGGKGKRLWGHSIQASKPRNS